jgi:hypothetical protein
MIEKPQEDIDAWKKTMKDYKDTKTQLPWGKNPQVTYVDERAKKEIDAKYNPILQRYTDVNAEQVVKEREDQTMTHTLAKNKVIFSP